MADRVALLRWIREVSLEPDKTGVLKDEASLEGGKRIENIFIFPRGAEGCE